MGPQLSSYMICTLFPYLFIEKQTPIYSVKRTLINIITRKIISQHTNTVKCIQLNTERAFFSKYNGKEFIISEVCAMGKIVDYKNRDRFIQLGIAISTLRRIRGLSQEKLAERASISRSLLSNIEAPNLAYGFSLDVFYSIADALDIAPEDLIKASVFPDGVIGSK